jgi:hypothetical protein
MTSIAVNQHTLKEAKIASKTFDLSLGDFVLHSAVYFRKTGIDPSKESSESPGKAMEEMNKRVGQVVAFMRAFEQEKLNPLLEQLMLLTHQLNEPLKKLPRAERFEDVIKNINHHISAMADQHKKRMDFLEQSQQIIMQESKRELTAFTKKIDSLEMHIQEMQAAIDTKLTKKMFG